MSSESSVELTNPNTLLTVEQFCRWAQVSPRTWRSWVQDGTAPKRIKLGRGIRIRVSDAIAWAESRYVD